MIKRSMMIFMACVLFMLAPLSAAAESVELSATMKKAFDKLMEDADAAQAKSMKALYQQALDYQRQITQLDQSIKTLSSENDAAESKLRKEIMQIDSAKLASLDAKLQQTKDRYKPLFNSYTLINQQLAAARKLKDKDLTSILSLQADQIKLLVQLAREDIKSKEAALKAAKDQAASLMKRIRDTLAGIDKLEARIKSERSSVTALNKQTSTMKSSVYQAIKLKDVKLLNKSLTTLASHVRTIVTHKEAIMKLEQEIKGVISKARAMLPPGSTV
ncbi:hypothetical protein [Paenibacillus marinisediminis]